MSSAKAGSPAADRARQALCQEIARLLEEGACTVRVRIGLSAEGPVAAWFYSRRENRWHKEPRVLTERSLVRALHAELKGLATKQRSDEWAVTRRSTADHLDTDIRFHREAVCRRVEARRAAAVHGLLFRGGHDSRKDIRRAIRFRR